MSKMAQIVEEEQYKQECGNACGCVLTINTPIMCWNNGESELTLCNECYWDAGYWKDDQNEDNREEIEDFKCCEEEEEDDCTYNFYICRHCFAFGTDDPDCGKCGKEMCVLLYQEENAALALVKAKQD